MMILIMKSLLESTRKGKWLIIEMFKTSRKLAYTSPRRRYLVLPNFMVQDIEVVLKYETWVRGAHWFYPSSLACGLTDIGTIRRACC